MNQTRRHANRRLIWAICTFVVCIWLGLQAQAQQMETPIDPTVAQTTEVDFDQLVGDQLGLEYAEWTTTAERAEGLLLRDVASVFALERLRISLTEWRDVFASEMRDNAARIDTLNSQLAALGAAPTDDETESAIVTDRRNALILQRDEIAAPVLIAAEANARAVGMISEIDDQIRERETDAYLERGTSPLNVLQWPGAISYLWEGVRAIGAENIAGLTTKKWSAVIFGQVLWALLFIVLAAGLFVCSHTWARQFATRSGDDTHFVVRELVGAVLQVVLPLTGLTALIYGLSLLDIFGVRGDAILRTVPLTGSVIIVAVWLGRQFFPEGDKYGPLNHSHVVRGQARRVSIALAWIAALWLPYKAFLGSGSENENAVALLNFPFILILSVVLFRFASLLRQEPDADAAEDVGLGRTRSLIGRATQVVSVIATLAAMAGYDAAAQAILFPTILTLGLLGVMIYLQSLSGRVFDLVCGVDESQTNAFVPAIIGLVLAFVSVPLIALIWGAEVADLQAYWVRFTEGVKLGEVQISPSDFLTFIFIFCFGYFLTGFIKNALGTSILPRTSLDLGAQDAIVAGFGYVGIFLTAVIAITTAGIDLSNLAIVAGALSVGIGFGLQTIVSNFVSGIILLIERPISQGDWIEVGDRMGYVRDISVRATRIETFDRSDVIVPNADLISNQVINWTRGNLAGRLILPVGVAYGTDVDQVAAILKEIAEAHPMVVMSPPPSVLFMNFGADALEFEIRAILRDVNFVVSVRSELNFQISRRFAAENIEIPFAQRDIWLRNPEVLGQTGPNKDTPKPPAAPFQQAPQRDQNDADVDGVDGGDMQ